MEWTCECGSVVAELPEGGTRIVCYCRSCRGFVERLGKGDRLDPAGGNDLLQLAPDGARFLKGVDKLAWMRITEKGPLRWYATCCNTPVANTLATPGIPFASFQTAFVAPQAALGPVRARVHLKGATAHVAGPTGSLLPLFAGVFWRIASARLSGRWRTNPFFGADGKPVAARREPA